MATAEIGDATIGLAGLSARLPSDELRLDDWLFVRLRHSLNCA